ncbi:MAG: long-chain fatty acid--CoA ligase [Myxococcota bacterium]
MKRRAIEERVLAWISQGVDAVRDDEVFGTLALELFAYQYQYGEAYRRLCDAAGRSPSNVEHWSDIPAVPTGAFKRARFATFPAEREVRTFRTSGSSLAERGELHLDTLELYDASLLATFDAYVCRGSGALRFVVLAPSAAEAPDSSLSYMFDRAARLLGSGEPSFPVHAGGWDPERAIADLEGLRGPAAVVGTAFAFVHLLDELAARGKRLSLPAGTRVMETGGFKGRSRELTREELHAGIERALGVPTSRIINQYGMCELASQFYEASLRTGEPSTAKRVPPWVRTRVVDPGTFEDVAPGETGVLVHYDLANTGSALAVQTSDLGRRLDAGFAVLGRLRGAEERGCSIAADVLLASG